MLPAGAPIARGTNAITKTWQGFFGPKNFGLTFAADTIELASAGDIAYEVGTYKLGFDTDKGPIGDVRKYAVVWKKTGDGWKAVADIFNSDGAAK